MNSIKSTPVSDVGFSSSEVSNLESAMKAAIAAGATRDAQPEMRLDHSFVPGAYARQLWRPKGTLIVGKIHKFGCFNFLLSGSLRIWDESGVRDIVSPYFFVSTGGSRRVTFAHEDSLFVTVHVTNETELDKIEAELIESSEIGEVLPEAVKHFLESKE